MKQLRAAFSAVLFLALCLTASAQVTLTQQQGPAFSQNNMIFPIVRYPLVTVTGNGSATISIGSVSTATCRVTGTYSAASTAVQISNDNTNFTTIAWLPVGGGPAVTSITANGLYQANVGGGITQLKFLNSGTFTGTSQIFNCSGSATQAMDIASYDTLPADPCQDKTVQKQSASFSIVATTTAVIPAVAGKNVWVCDIQGIESGTAGAYTVKAGTQTTNPCDTGAVTLAGPETPTVGTQQFFGWGGASFGPPQIPVSNQVCITVATATFGGSITFVQQ